MADANLNALIASINALKGGFTEADKALVLDALSTFGDGTPSIMELTTVMENLQEEDAQTIPNFDGLDATLKNEGERYRAWIMSTPDLADRCMEYLLNYAWVMGANPIRRKFVENCLIDNRILPGRWRVVGCRKMALQGKTYVIEILRRGYAVEIDWTEAFLVEGHSQRTNDEIRMIEFRYFDPRCVESARAVLAASSFTNVTVQAQQLTGAWVASDIIPKPEQDGSYTITLILRNANGSLFPYTSLSSMFRAGNTIVYRNWPSPISVPQSQGGGIYRVQDALSNDGFYDATLVYEYGLSSGAVYYRSMSTMLREGSSILYKSWPTVITSPLSQGSGIYRVQQSLQDDGTYDGQLVYECGLSTGKVSFRSMSTMFREGNTILYKSWPTSLSAPESGGSGIYRVQQSLQDDGTYDGQLVYECGTASGKVEFRSMSTMFREGNTILYKTWPTSITAPQANGSGIYRVQQSIQDDGTYDGQLVYEAGIASGRVEYKSLSTMFRDGNTIIYKSWPTSLTSPAATGSGIYRVQQSLQDDGSYDGQLVYECGTATGSVAFRSLSTLFRSGNTLLYKAWPTAITAPTSSGSGIYRVQQSLQDDGTYDGQLVYECGTSSGQVAFRSMSTMFREGNTIIYKSWPSAITAPSSTGSGIYRVQQSLQDDGTYDASMIYECGTATGQVAFKSLSTLLRNGNTMLYKAWPVPVIAPESGAGGIYRVQQSLQDDGTYDGALVYECGPSGGSQAVFLSLGSMMRLGNTTLYKAWPSPITSPGYVTGGVYRVQQSMQDDGTYDGQLVYEARSGVIMQVSARKSIMTKMTQGIYRAQETPPSMPDAVQGRTLSLSINRDEDGLYDADTQELEATPKAIFKTWDTINGTCGLYIYKNWGSPISMSDSSNNVSCLSSINDDGSYDTNVSITPPTSSGSSSDWSDSGSHKTKLEGMYGPKGIGSFIVWVYQRKTYNKAESDVTTLIGTPDAGYKVVPSWGAYHTGVWIHGKGSYQGVVVLYKA